MMTFQCDRSLDPIHYKGVAVVFKVRRKMRRRCGSRRSDLQREAMAVFVMGNCAG
jgi:hypothetical protein